MQCSRLKHFARINYDGTISRCGHMVDAPKFQSFSDMETSQWLQNTIDIMHNDQWPSECVRCQTSEAVGQLSIRHYSMEFHEQAYSENREYLVVGGVLDNICNSACQSCNAQHSTKIGALQSKEYIQINNTPTFYSLPLDRIVKLDINGGEPTTSPAYQRLLENLPPNVKEVRVNTNGIRPLPGIIKLIDSGVKLTITVSFDGIGRVHEYVRWPSNWEHFESTLRFYRELGDAIELNTWTTVHALNVGDLTNIINYTKQHNIKHSWALLEQPEVLSVKYSNHFTRTAVVPAELENIVAKDSDNTVELQLWTAKQDVLRGIQLWDYYR
jgi:sulfatase maturation enzyme AslB (radical SAM superfamily)